jgi:hypothetical protein
VKTDGHHSYPYVVAGMNGNHIVVDHEIGFKNADGYHTNLIKESGLYTSQTSKQEKEGLVFLCLDILRNIFGGEIE